MNRSVVALTESLNAKLAYLEFLVNDNAHESIIADQKRVVAQYQRKLKVAMKAA